MCKLPERSIRSPLRRGRASVTEVDILAQSWTVFAEVKMRDATDIYKSRRRVLVRGPKKGHEPTSVSERTHLAVEVIVVSLM